MEFTDLITALIQRQSDIIESIKQAERNFKKDPTDRKTREYLDARIEKLDKLWAEFNNNDNKLAQYRNDEYPYFSESQYDKARQYYNDVRLKFTSHQPVVGVRKVDFTAPSTSKSEIPSPEIRVPTPRVAPTGQLAAPLIAAATAGTSSHADEASAPPAQAPAGVSHPLDSHCLITTPIQVAELLSMQRTNFRAFSRMIRNINLDELSCKWELEDEVRNLQSRWKNIDLLHLKIDNILQGSDDSYEDEFNYYEHKYLTLKRALNHKIASTAHLQDSTPKIEIPIFSGNYNHWPTFHDLFSESIHKNNMLSKCQKMQHLKGKLKGEAERIIQHLHISAENYDTAWDLLTHRYNNTQLLFTKQIETFLNQPVVQKQSAFELKRLHDISVECIHAIQNLGVDTSTWDPILVHLISKKLDAETYGDYKEARKSPRDLPSLDEMIKFLEGKFTALEPINSKSFYNNKKSVNQTQNSNKNNPTSNNNKGSNNSGKYKNQYQSNATRTTGWTCPLCNKNHSLFKCNQFTNLTSDDKLQTVLKLDVCQNCLYSHNGNNCSSTKKCKQCQGAHNTLLHDAILNAIAKSMPTLHAPPATRTSGASPITSSNQIKSTQLQPAINMIPTSQTGGKQHSVNHVATDDEEILLTTLSLQIQAADGSFIVLRALLDQGSQISLISENAVHWLGLPRQYYNASVSGIGHGAKQSKGIVSLTCRSIYNDYEFNTQALVIARVINNLPNNSFSKQSWSHLQNINLADPDYNVSKPIDLLLDASIYSDIIMSGLIKGPNRAPIAQQTKLGWILSGNVKTFGCHVVLNNIADLSQYWEMEEIHDSPPTLTQEDEYCENIYKSTTKRLPNGKYEVALPMKPNFEQILGLSKSKAIAQFHNLECKMSKNEEFSDSYKQFMKEYESLCHMKQVYSDVIPSCYLPHHGVLRSDSTTTKLRTVFNASSKTSTGYSLNDLMERGPNLQADLHSLILVWRQHKYVIIADIEKMFRQIFIRESDQHLQRIIWRYSPDDPLRAYQLTTITYGTKAAPYLAMRTLKQLATDESKRYPLAAQALNRSFYMDDLLEGSKTIDQTKELQQQLIEILKGAGMNIRKWSSNNTELIKDLSSDQLDAPLEFKCSETRKTLGLRWNPNSDTFTFQNKFHEKELDNKPLTKRKLLSNISKIFDPLGWLSPLTIRAKLLFQRTWSEENLEWDSKLSDQIEHDWRLIKQDFQQLNIFEIPRYLGDHNEYQIHGFCDASQNVYACSIYIVAKNYKVASTSKLLTAKTKLAPIKNKLTLPRLELSSALLLARLMKKVIDSLSHEKFEVYAWSDSMIVLGWIHGDVARWKEFVANRVQKITSIIPSTCWHHVRSEQNAADCATRGLTATQLREHSLWWEGPQWLLNFNPTTLEQITYPPADNECKKHVNAALFDKTDKTHSNKTFIIQILNECSSIRRVATTVGWFSRYIAWLRNKHNSTYLPYLSSNEMQNSYNIIIKTIRSIEFENEISRLKQNKTLQKSSKLLCLNPFIDTKDGLLKVGGRLNNSFLSNLSRLTDLIIQQAHAMTLHGGPRLTLSYLREKYWILSGLRTVKRELRKCVRCRRFSNEKSHQIMADLPQPRVTPSHPFTHTGVDFTGHFDVKANKGRGVKTIKGYVAVFVCLATKAVHLELVSDLSTPGFLAAFRRFCSRRGTPSHMYSDNGTNFTCANRLLQKEYKEILQTINQDFFSQINEMNIQWSFNAPSFPSSGGLWEAAVKRLKYHLRRVVGDQKLTYEEFITLLHQVEACLNSRPLIALTESPDDDYLTPGHFLIGGTLLSRPLTEPEQINLTTRWHMVQTMTKHFWKKWSLDYLQELQTRSKWTTSTKNLEVDSIVLIKDENIPPGKWALGRIIAVHPGKDGHVRIASIKTKNNIIKRPIIKLCPLPVNEDQSITTPQSTNDVQEASNSELTQTNLQNKPTVPTTRSRRKRFCHSILINLLLFLFTISSSHCTYNVSNFNTNQTMYFDKIYEMSLIQDEWKLLVYFNLSTYWSGIQDINDYVSHIETLVNNRSNTSAQYKNILLQLKHELSEIEHYNNLILAQHSIRSKRGLINGVGYLANSLFGVLDDRFLKQYEKDIDKINLNENHLQQLLKNQTSVLEAHYNIIRRNENIMNKQFGIIQSQLQNIYQFYAKIQTESHLEMYILSTSFSAQIIISNLRRIQDEIIDAVTDISHGHLDAHLIPPEQLQNQINLISSHIRSDLSLPADKHNIQELYKLMKINAKVGRRYLIIEIKIPLISKETFELDKIISLPYKGYVIQTTTPYIAYNLQKDLVLFVNENDINSCIHLTTEKILCSLDKPIYEFRITQSICNINIRNMTMCDTMIDKCEERWIKFHVRNRWLFSCCEKCSVRIFCNKDIEMKTLTENGIMDIGQGCTVKSNTFSIFGHNNYLSEISVQKSLPTGLSTSSILNHILNSTPTEFYKPEDHNDTWRDIKLQIDNLKHESSSPLTIHDIHQYSIMYAILGILITIGCYYLYKRHRSSRQDLRLARAVASSNMSVAFQAAAAPQPVQSDPYRLKSLREDNSVIVRADKATSPPALVRSVSTQSVTLNIPSVSDSE